MIQSENKLSLSEYDTIKNQLLNSPEMERLEQEAEDILESHLDDWLSSKVITYKNKKTYVLAPELRQDFCYKILNDPYETTKHNIIRYYSEAFWEKIKAKLESYI